jgi:hypothetical protein
MTADENQEQPDDSQNKERIAWHPAFRSAIKLEFEEYQDALEFKFENELNDEPLKVDVIVIKKVKDVPIKNAIAAIFRKDNIFEYKSPTDYFAVEDFYKVYGLCLLLLVHIQSSNYRYKHKHSGDAIPAGCTEAS